MKIENPLNRSISTIKTEREEFVIGPLIGSTNRNHSQNGTPLNCSLLRLAFRTIQ